MHPLAQRVHDAGADAVEARGHLVSAATEFATRVQYGHNDFQRRLLHLRLQIDRDTAAVVGNCYRAIGVDRDCDTVVVAGQRLVDGVVDQLVDHVVQAVDIGVADVHARAATHRLESLEHLDVGARVFGRCLQLQLVLELVCLWFWKWFFVT